MHSLSVLSALAYLAASSLPFSHPVLFSHPTLLGPTSSPLNSYVPAINPLFAKFRTLRHLPAHAMPFTHLSAPVVNLKAQFGYTKVINHSYLVPNHTYVSPWNTPIHFLYPRRSLIPSLGPLIRLLLSRLPTVFPIPHMHPMMEHRTPFNFLLKPKKRFGSFGHNNNPQHSSIPLQYSRHSSYHQKAITFPPFTGTLPSFLSILDFHTGILAQTNLLLVTTSIYIII